MTNKQKILVVDDEKTIREVVRRYLELEGFDVIEAESGSETLQVIKDQHPDLIVLDIMLPGIDGFAITRKIRNPTEMTTFSSHNIPIIFLSARTDEVDRINGFEVGADDYITKPFSPRELVARVKAVLKRSIGTHTSNSPLTVDRLHIDPKSRTVVVENEQVALTAKEFDLLWFLARHPRQVFSRAQLLDNVWGYEFFGDESTVTVHIRRLREKVEEDPGSPRFIQTVWGIGYKFETPLAPGEEDEAVEAGEFDA